MHEQVVFCQRQNPEIGQSVVAFVGIDMIDNIPLFCEMLMQKRIRHQLVHIDMDTVASCFVAHDPKVSQWNCYLLRDDCRSSFDYPTVLVDGIVRKVHAFVLANSYKILVLYQVDRLV